MTNTFSGSIAADLSWAVSELGEAEAILDERIVAARTLLSQLPARAANKEQISEFDHAAERASKAANEATVALYRILDATRKDH